MQFFTRFSRGHTPQITRCLSVRHECVIFEGKVIIMTEKESLAAFKRSIEKNRPKTKEEAVKYLIDLGVLDKNGRLSKNYKSESYPKAKSVNG